MGIVSSKVRVYVSNADRTYSETMMVNREWCLTELKEEIAKRVYPDNVGVVRPDTYAIATIKHPDQMFPLRDPFTIREDDVLVLRAPEALKPTEINTRFHMTRAIPPVDRPRHAQAATSSGDPDGDVETKEAPVQPAMSILRLNGSEHFVLPKVKLVLIGFKSSGKTALLQRYMYDAFQVSMASTNGIESKTATLAIGHDRVTVHIHDTAGQELYGNVRDAVVERAHGIIVVYDITSLESFHDAERLLRQVTEKRLPLLVPRALLLIGTKTDLANSRVVPTSSGVVLANKYDAWFNETSARTGAGVLESVNQLSASVYNHLVAAGDIHKVAPPTSQPPAPSTRRGLGKAGGIEPVKVSAGRVHALSLHSPRPVAHKTGGVDCVML